jgi:bacteriocin biosynthesis cyclodehydratase domain-containing protein
MNSYSRNDIWSLQYENGLLVLNAGADYIYAVEDLNETVAEEILDLWKTNFEQTSYLSNRAKEILEELKSAGIVQIEFLNKETLNFDLRYLGSSNQAVFKKVSQIIEEDSLLHLTDSSKSDFTLFLRTNSVWKDILDNYNEKNPHMLVDISFHHTISVGPLVIPRETACLGCLVGRITNLWGDPKPPATPKIQEYECLIASIIVTELKKIAENNQGLVNRTVSFNFEDYKVQSDALYKLPWCPFCGQEDEMNKIGSVELPWVRK